MKYTIEFLRTLTIMQVFKYFGYNNYMYNVYGSNAEPQGLQHHPNQIAHMAYICMCKFYEVLYFILRFPLQLSLHVICVT